MGLKRASSIALIVLAATNLYWLLHSMKEDRDAKKLKAQPGHPGPGEVSGSSTAADFGKKASRG